MPVRIVFMGSSRLMHACADVVACFYGNEAEYSAIETSSNLFARRSFSHGGIIRAPQKELAWKYLEKLDGRVYLFCVNNPFLIPARFCAMPDWTLLNLHHSLLPAHPGRNAEAWTLFNQDAFGGVTWHIVDAGIDTGRILAQKRFPITADMTSTDYLKASEQLAIEALKGVLPLDAALLRPPAVENKHSEKATTALQSPNGGELDLSWSIGKSSAFLRAMNYGPLRVLGCPRVVFRGVEYQIDGYEMVGDCVGEERMNARLLEGSDGLRMMLEAPSSSIVLRVR